MNHSQKKSSRLIFAVSWILVLIPLGWGVFQSAVKSLPLFQMPAVSKTILRIRYNPTGDVIPTSTSMQRDRAAP
jgi:hypothetical protein